MPNQYRPLFIAVTLAISLSVSMAADTWSQQVAAVPQTLYWYGDHLAQVKTSTEPPSKTVRAALKQLEENADLALTRGPYSVVNKDIVPPSGDKHDYLSFSRYWWPNPDTPDGLPYVRRDGEVNRKLLSRGDRVRIAHFYDDFETLALAAYLVDNDKYGPHAAKLVRTWFIDPKTRMNPNVNFGQGVPGRAHGRGVGVIDTRHFIRVLDSIALLRQTSALSDADETELKSWFASYLDWLMTSDLADHERKAKNNHGSWYAAQTSCVALFVGNDALAKEIVEVVRDQRISTCFAPDGSQPLELARTRSLHYSLFNLAALTIVARMGDHVDVDLWATDAADKRSLRGGLDYVAPHVLNPKGWPHPKLGEFSLSDRNRQLFLLAHHYLGDGQYLELFRKAPAREQDSHYSSLLFPTTVRK